MKRKIVIIHHCGDIGGAGRSLIQTAKILEENYTVSVLCPSGTPMHNLLMENNISVVPYDFNAGSVEYYSGGPSVFSRTYFSQFVKRFTSWDKIKKLLEQENADIIMLNSITLSFLIPKIKRNFSAKTVCFVRETFPENGCGIMFRKYKNMLNKSDAVLFISDYDRLLFNLRIKHTITLKNSVPDCFFESTDTDSAFEAINVARKENIFYALYAGGTSMLKGSQVIADAMAKLPENIHLLLCGCSIDDGKEIFGKYGDRVHYLGMLKDMVPAYTACDVLVFPSTKAHQARPAFEAGCFRKPVIISGFKQTEEFVRNEFNGLCFTPRDGKSLAEKILYLSKNPKKAAEYGENNYKLSIENHSIKNAADILLSVTNSVLEDEKIKHLHIMTASNYGTIDGYTKLVNENFDNSEHLFIIRDTKDNPQHSLENFKNIIWLPEAQRGELNRMLAYIDSAQHVYWHSMGWYWTTQLKMLMHPSYMKKSTWVEWGADLFNWKRNDGNPVIRYAVNTVHRLWRKNVGSVVVIFPTDEEVYRKTFNKKQNIMLATYSVYRHTQIDDQKPAVFHDPSLTNILVGHSATPLCNHLDVIDALAKFKDENIHLYIPLSYGDGEYAKQVISRATEIFGDKVTFQMENMPLWDYVHFLWDIDIAIFKVYRQIALGNICRLLYMTKKVYLPKGSLLYNYYEENDTEIYDCDAIKNMTFEDFATKPKMTEPSECIKERMNRGAVIDQWKSVFEKSGGN